ncbi:MAG: type IV pilus twitching motility protein PilT [Candidatus Hydrogenedentes bacterium]|nr:type IV pilus twitching motility protein PilT [Candidatus Hydrogenedentota bacterium]
MFELKTLLERCAEYDASDLHLKAGSPPVLRIDGELVPQGTTPISEEDTDRFVDELLVPEQKEIFYQTHEVDTAYSVKGLGRFRTNIYMQRGSISIAMRRIKSSIQSFQELHLPPIVELIAQRRHGLVLVTGVTGSGKSTTLAAIIDYINKNRRVHIVAIEDPIEYLHTDNLALIDQREVSIDTPSFASALKSVLRQDPDVILIGEMRDPETFHAAISATETGHLVFSTLHTADAKQTIDRIIDLFPPGQHDQIRAQLALNLRAIMCQRLLPRADGTGRVPAVEVMIANPSIRKLIHENRISQIPTAMQSARKDGMQTFNDSLKYLFDNKLITKEDAMIYSDNPDELAMNLQGIYLSQSKGGILR